VSTYSLLNLTVVTSEETAQYGCHAVAAFLAHGCSHCSKATFEEFSLDCVSVRR